MEDRLIRVSEAASLVGMTASGIKSRIDAGILTRHTLPPTRRRKGAFAYVSLAEVMAMSDHHPIKRRVKQTEILASDTDAAYLAGIIDGEGTIHIAGNRVSPAVRVAVFNTDFGLLEWIQSVFGGAVRTNRGKGPGMRQCWQWEAGAANAVRILELIQPYVRVKRQQVVLALEYQRRLIDYGGSRWHHLTQQEIDWRESQKQAISRLNRRDI